MPPALRGANAFVKGKYLPSSFSLLLWSNVTSVSSQLDNMDRFSRTELASTMSLKPSSYWELL